MNEPLCNCGHTLIQHSGATGKCMSGCAGIGHDDWVRCPCPGYARGVEYERWRVHVELAEVPAEWGPGLVGRLPAAGEGRAQDR